MFNCNPEELSDKRGAKAVINSHSLYIALGELKGGIDPAGADEHWKTAQTALSRIREAFEKAGHKPYIFFIGSAIESKMASEIWDQLQNDILANAANLNDDNQLASLSHWLCSL